MSNSDLDKPLDMTEPIPASAATSPLGEAKPIALDTLARFLIGDRDAIVSLASCRPTLWLGMILVFSAAFAREYDGEDLLYEPWHLLLPLVASLATSFLLFGLISIVAWFRRAGLSGFWSRYRTFLGLYWMTAPLAWLYGIPVERFLSAGDATTANLTFLACVSLWRVILITRVLSILFTARYWQVFFIVMLFADSVALALVSQIDVQVIAVMGGVRLTESEGALAGAKLLVIFFGTLSWPVWCIVSLTLAGNRWASWNWALATTPPSLPISRSVWSLATVSVCVWLIPLPWTQGEQQLRSATERHFRASRYGEMLATMSARQRHNFPPHWDPPPHIGASRERRRIAPVVSAFTPDTAPWVRALFCEKLSAALGRNEYLMETLWVETDVEELLELLDKLPEGAEILKDKSKVLDYLPGIGGVEVDNKSPRLAVLLMKNAKPPDETTQFSSPSSAEWMWNGYLEPLEAVKDRQLVLKHHAEHLKRILGNSRLVPEKIQDRMRRLLSEPSPIPSPKS